MNLKLLVSIAVATSLIGSLVVAAPAKANEDWQRAVDSTPQGLKRVWVEEFGGFERYSAREGVLWKGVDGSEGYESWFCDQGDTTSGQCNLDDPKVYFTSSAILPFCETQRQENCIESLEIGSVGQPLEPARFVRHVDSRKLPAIPSQGLMAGNSTPLFESSRVHSGGQSTYAASVVAQIEYDRGTRSFITKSLNVAVYPYSERRASNIGITITESALEDGKKVRKTGFSAPSGCTRWIEQGACGIEQAFPDGSEVKLTMRVPDTFTGWFRGRLKSPQISVSRFSNSNNKISVSAEPIRIARFLKNLDLNTATPAEREASQNLGFSHWGRFKKFEALRNTVNDTAIASTSHWSFSTIDYTYGNRCLTSDTRVLGIVTTNATVFDGVVPTWTSGTLSYEVSSLHYLPNGDLNLGTYDLVMRSDVARCLYGFSKAPLNAKVSVVNDKGERSTATTVVGEKNGWLRLAAYGFTFSQKTIKVKITQKKKR